MRIIHRTPFYVLKKYFSSYSVIPVYHVVSNEHLPHIKHLYKVKTIKDFISEIEFFAKHYNIVDVQDLTKSSKKNMLHLTFDDGYSECYNIIRPILLKKGIPATFFINTDFIDNRNLMKRCIMSLINEEILSTKSETKLKVIRQWASDYPSIQNWIFSFDTLKDYNINRLCKLLDIDVQGFLNTVQPYLSHQQIKELVKDGFTIGSHGKNHVHFKNLSLQNQLTETIETSQYISERYNQHLKLFAFPYDDLNVSMSYFNAIQSEIDVSFGTAGFLKDPAKCNFQRIWMEADQNKNVKDFFSSYYKEKMMRKYINKDDYVKRK